MCRFLSLKLTSRYVLMFTVHMEEAGDGKRHDAWVCLWMLCMLYIGKCMIIYVIFGMIGNACDCTTQVLHSVYTEDYITV